MQDSLDIVEVNMEKPLSDVPGETVKPCDQDSSTSSEFNDMFDDFLHYSVVHKVNPKINVKSVLKSKVQQRRLANGEKEVDCAVLFLNRNKEKPSLVDVEKDDKRKEQNKLAAQKSRQKQKDNLNSLEKERQDRSVENKKLKADVSKLEQRISVFKTFLTTHEMNCYHTSFVGQAFDDDSVYDVESPISDGKDTVSPAEAQVPEDDYFNHDGDAFLDQQDVCLASNERPVIAQETGPNLTPTDVTPVLGHDKYYYIQNRFQTPILVSSVSHYDSIQASSPVSIICDEDDNKYVGRQECASTDVVRDDDVIIVDGENIITLTTDFVSDQKEAEKNANVFKSGDMPLVDTGFGAALSDSQVALNCDSNTLTVNDTMLSHSRFEANQDVTSTVECIGDTSLLHNDRELCDEIINKIDFWENQNEPSLHIIGGNTDKTSDVQSSAFVTTNLSNMSLVDEGKEMALQAGASLTLNYSVKSIFDMSDKFDMAFEFLKSENFIGVDCVKNGKDLYSVAETVNKSENECSGNANTVSTQDDVNFDITSPLGFENLNVDFSMLVPNQQIDHPITQNETPFDKIKKPMKRHHDSGHVGYIENHDLTDDYIPTFKRQRIL